MLTEKQFFELIKALQSSNFSTTEILGLSFAIIIVALIVNFIVSFITEKAKISATNANYEILRKQLALNTTTIKDIEKRLLLSCGFLNKSGKKSTICMSTFTHSYLV